MEVRQLEYFVAVAEELHFGRAADRLHIGQPAVSQQIARLERELGAQLFDRTTRRVQLTAAGRRLLPEAKVTLTAIARLRATVVEPVGELTGTLRVGTSEGLGDRLDQVLDSIANQAPRLQVRLVSLPSARRLDALRQGQLDAAFLRPAPKVADLSTVAVWTETLVAALPATHPAAARSILKPADLADVPLRMSPREANPGLHDLLDRHFQSMGVKPTRGVPIISVYDALAEIGTGDAAWTVLYSAAAEQLRVRRIAFRKLDLPAVETVVATAPGPRPAAVQLLLDTCLTAS
ncbi:DNA-binding transcriptional LysR family regulator [Kribbella voronezhensis]|uniref:DNA-binding transcriptional LysR family regulator n=1 Tax=Kribbella voronezhensis TaxID=2512212 RepID=A0A4R7T803_9ACTN|nr:LysR family transcriptional regulator [Kribbella voronezhensis]TDU87915.1 DNA-binding transcriptional LysR family regulator [Kribbella voronezhensis]